MSIQERINEYSVEINDFNASSAEELEQYRLKFLVNKGIVKSLFEEFKTVSPEEKRALGKVLNEFKQSAENKYKALSETLSASSPVTNDNNLQDLTLPGEGFELGSRHPLSLVRKEIVEIFNKMGFVVAEKPE